MERRVHRRFPRRVEVRFWRHGESQVHSSFTTNVSRTGIFLGSATSLIPGERLRLELVESDKGFVVEGKVARVHRVSLALRHVEQPGVGVRFLLPSELVEDLLPLLARQPGTAVPPGEPPIEAELVVETPVQPERPAPKSTTTSSASDKRIVPVIFDDASAFLSVYHRDIQSGGLFVSADDPAELNEIIWIELQLPLADEPPKLIAAKVVQRFAPDAAVGGGRNLLSGMAVQFLDPDRVVADLKPLLARLRR